MPDDNITSSPTPALPPLADATSFSRPKPSFKQILNSPGGKSGVWALVCGLVAFFLLPPLGILGIILGFMARKKGAKKLGTIGGGGF